MRKERTGKDKNESVPRVSIQETDNFCILHVCLIVNAMTLDFKIQPF